MPTDQDRDARRRAEAKLATEYGWPAPRRRFDRLRLVLVGLAAASTIALSVALWGVVLGWWA